jgi:hypothetical protein
LRKLPAERYASVQPIPLEPVQARHEGVACHCAQVNAVQAALARERAEHAEEMLTVLLDDHAAPLPS